MFDFVELIHSGDFIDPADAGFFFSEIRGPAERGSLISEKKKKPPCGRWQGWSLALGRVKLGDNFTVEEVPERAVKSRLLGTKNYWRSLN